MKDTSIYFLFIFIFIIPHLTWLIRYIPIYKEVEKRKSINFVLISLLYIFLALNQFFFNIFNLDIWVFILLQILLFPSLRYCNKDLN